MSYKNMDSQKRLLGKNSHFSSSKRSLPVQKIPAAVVEESEEEEEEEHIELDEEDEEEVEEVQDEEVQGNDGSQSEPKTKKFKHKFLNNFDSLNDFLKSSSLVQLKLKSENHKQFFRKSKITMRFGKSVKLIVRVGLDVNSKLWRVYIAKDKGEYKPVVLDFLLDETHEVICWLKSTIHTIEENQEAKTICFNAKNLTFAGLNPDLESFWEHVSVFYIESLLFRIRPFYYGGNYLFTFQNPKVYENENFVWLGPSVRTGLNDTKLLLAALVEIKKMCE